MMFLSATASSILFIALLKASPFRPAVEKAGKKYVRRPRSWSGNLQLTPHQHRL